MITVEMLEELTDNFKRHCKKHRATDCISFKTSAGCLMSTRVFGLNLPRMVGKTSALESYANRHSALRFDGVSGTFVTRFSDFTNRYDTLHNTNFRGQRNTGMKFQCIVADEFNHNKGKPEVKEFFWQTVIDLKTMGLFTEDFYIIHLGTDTHD